MRLPIALATLFVATAVALPAYAATPAPIGASLRDAAASQIETVQNRQTQRQRRAARNYRGYNAYAAEPRYRRGYYGYNNPGYSNPWGRCVRLGEHTPGRSAFPDWDVC